MKYVHCYRCRARFHTGVVYERIEECPRCGGPLRAHRSRLRDHIEALLRRGDDLDWEAITGSQYIPRVPRGQSG